MKQAALNTRTFITIAIQGLVITVVVSSLVLLVTSSGDTLEQVRKHLNMRTVPLLALPIIISWTCNGLRFWLMCRCIQQPIPLFRAWAIAVSSEFATAASPGGVGGTAVRLGFLKKSGLSFVQGGSLLAADVALDLLFFLLIIPFALYALLHCFSINTATFSKPWNLYWLLLLLVPIGLALNHRRIFQTLEKHPAYQKYRLKGKLRLGLKKLKHSLQQGRNSIVLIFKNHKGILWVNFALSALQFSARYSVLPLAILLLGIPVNPFPLLVMQGALYMISMLVVAPGGGGSVEVLAAVALPQLMPVHLVGVAILLWRLFTYHFYLLFGGMVFARTFKKLM
ncbi:lysylphosphatidylglycerol synthase transmembrane domain-containing protein [Pontiellaceae bacterium B12219]|nr:lysylphosphatidylglycerol synthase transmembrane domain-containing protein [Pontiellaceae bacterium B12219]